MDRDRIEERRAMDGDSDRLHDYFDGRLAPEEKARFERRLAADAALSDRLRELRELDAALGTLPGHEAPRDFAARVVRSARRRRGAILRLAIPLAVAAAALVAAVFAPGALRDLRAPKSEPQPQAEDRYIWEADEETYGSLALTDLEDQILEELKGT